jgi:hypothetical protein
MSKNLIISHKVENDKTGADVIAAFAAIAML